LFSSIITYRSLKANQEKILAEEQLKQFEELKKYTNNLEQVYNNLRSFKHDYVNIMSSISSYLDEGRYAELTDYFYTNIMPLKKELTQNTDALNKLMNVKQLEIKSLLSYKMMYALEQNISITIDIPEVIEYINMDPIDLTRILGIYLDNSIEAAIETAHPQIGLHIGKMDNYIALIISNNFVNKGIPISKMSDPGTTTKGDGHGVGLNNVKQIFSRYDTLFHETYIDGDYFFQHVHFPN